MVLAVAIGVVVLANVALWAWQRRRSVASEESDLYAMQQGGAFGGAIGAAQARRSGLSADEVTVREDTEPVKFKL